MGFTVSWRERFMFELPENVGQLVDVPVLEVRPEVGVHNREFAD